ncbi:MAG: hypothetical protein HGA35_00240 [Erysipelotrichaceae bacterium]|nr:hypothetical protein [Erysipelotrichaceae bacterium]
MNKWVGKILIILLIFLCTSCKNDEINTIEYNRDFINEYKDEIKLLFGEINVINKERVSETFYGYTITQTIQYDVWDIEYKNSYQELKYIQLKNRYDFISSLSEIILNEITVQVIKVLNIDIPLSVYYENAPENIDTIKDIDSRYYPVNLSIDNLPADFLIIVSPYEDKVDDFKDSINYMIGKINNSNIKNVLLLEGNEAIQMDHGVLVIDGEVKYEKISVEDALKWIESNR